MIGHVRGVLSTYGSDAITPIVLQPDMVYANLWALRHSYSFRSVNHLHCQLQAGGRPSSPTLSNSGSPPPDITDILARFDDTPMRDAHAEPFCQDGGDDDGYYE